MSLEKVKRRVLFSGNTLGEGLISGGTMAW